MTTVGEVAAAQAAAYHPDLCFMGVYAIHPEYGMTIPYPEEVSIKRQLIHSSSRVIALVNPIKLNTVSRYQVCGIEDLQLSSQMEMCRRRWHHDIKQRIRFPVKQFEPPGMGGSYFFQSKNCVKMTVRFANINCTHLERSCTNVADKVRYRRTGACESQCTMILANRFQVILTQFFLYFIHQTLPYNQPGTWQFPGQLRMLGHLL